MYKYIVLHNCRQTTFFAKKKQKQDVLIVLMSKHIKASLIKSEHDSGYGTLIKESDRCFCEGM